MHWSKEIYFKLFLPQILPNVDRILHLDTNVLVLGNIKDFFETNMGNNLFCVDDNCVGVMLINLKDLRNDNILEEFKRQFTLNPKLNEEQFIIHTYKGKVQQAPDKYINTTRRLSKDISSSTKIIHFVSQKPYVLQGFKRKHLTSRGILNYYPYLEDFIDPRYMQKYKLAKFYILNFGHLTNSFEKRVRWFWHKYILRKKDFYFKSNWWTKQIHKYAIITKS